MVVSRKIREEIQEQAEKFIAEGGGVKLDEKPQYYRRTTTIRIPEDFWNKIGELRNRRLGQSRNSWILEAIYEKFERQRHGE